MATLIRGTENEIFNRLGIPYMLLHVEGAPRGDRLLFAEEHAFIAVGDLHARGEISLRNRRHLEECLKRAGLLKTMYHVQQVFAQFGPPEDFVPAFRYIHCVDCDRGSSLEHGWVVHLGDYYRPIGVVTLVDGINLANGMMMRSGVHLYDALMVLKQMAEESVHLLYDELSVERFVDTMSPVEQARVLAQRRMILHTDIPCWLRH